MAKAKLKTGDRKTSVSRGEVREVVRSSKTGRFVSGSYAHKSSTTKKK